MWTVKHNHVLFSGIELTLLDSLDTLGLKGMDIGGLWHAGNYVERAGIANCLNSQN
jgi:hypothetical protein